MRGGRRKGAGRKPRSEAREAITVRIEPEDAEKFRRLCAAKGRSQAEQITEWIATRSDWIEKSIEADTMRKHYANAEAVVEKLSKPLRAIFKDCTEDEARSNHRSFYDAWLAGRDLGENA